MKKALTGLIALLMANTITYADGYYPGMYKKDGSLDVETMLPYVLGGLIIWGIIIFSIAKIETSRKTKDHFYKGHKMLYLVCVISIFFHGAITSPEIGIYFLLLMRFILPFFVAADAKKLGRNRIVWWFMSFCALHISLLVLARSPRLLKLEEKQKSLVSTLVKEYDNKLNNLKELRQASILSKIEYNNKKRLLDKTYQEQQDELLENFRENESQIFDNSVLEKLDKAYRDGILSKEEYEVKRNEVIG